MAGGHREVADYLISVGAPSRGGKFHRAAVTIQTVWRLHRHRVKTKVDADINESMTRRINLSL